MKQSSTINTEHRLLLAFFENEPAAERALQTMIQSEVSMDHLSILGRASASGDDPLGVYYRNPGDRMVGWGKMGALWGGLLGMVSGAMGMFIIPGLAPLIAAGPIAEALIGAAGGAGLGGTAMAGAGAISQLGVAVHRMGVPKEQIEQFQERLKQGEYLLMLIVDNAELEAMRERLSQHRPALLSDFPYVGYSDALKVAAG